jgi:5,10-methylenetetrahydrofolate reductase
MSSVAVAALLARVGYSAVLQISCRDHNRIAIQGHVLGAGALGVANVLCLTGDGVESGDHPEAKPVFDLDAISLIGAVKRMRDEGRFMSGRKLASPPRVFIGCAENPCAPPLAVRAERFAKKIEAGAQFVQTQYIFDVPAFAAFMQRARDLGLVQRCFVLAGVGPLASARTARWMNKHVPGVNVPEDVIARLERAADPREEGKRVCIEIIQRLREIEGVAGVHVMAYRQEEYVSEIVHESGILRGRRPWRREAPPATASGESSSEGSSS